MIAWAFGFQGSPRKCGGVFSLLRDALSLQGSWIPCTRPNPLAQNRYSSGMFRAGSARALTAALDPEYARDHAGSRTKTRKALPRSEMESGRVGSPVSLSPYVIG